MIKLPSFQSLWIGFVSTFKRFPIQLLTAVVATVISFILIDLPYDQYQSKSLLYRLLYCCNLVVTLTLAVDLFAESRFFTNQKKWMLRALALACCAGIFFCLKPDVHTGDFYRICLFVFAFHLFVAFAPYILSENLNGFWQFNKTLFLRFLTSALYAGVLYAGLAIAILSVDKLFNTSIDGDTYGYLFALIGIAFQTAFFLAGIPKDFAALDSDHSFPKGLKIFTQYVLIPLMTIYLCILLAYEAKIAMAWELPKGFVSTLILGYAVFGILSLLLIYPIKEGEGNNWMKFFSKFFYVMMVPLIVLLVLSVSKRVSVYGVTESRYILMVLALWLSGITIYFLTSRKQNIKVIPISLAILALLIVYGPQSAFSVSKFSQLSRLKKLMASKKKVDLEERSAVVRYLVQNHGLTSLQSFTKVDLEAVEEGFVKKSNQNQWTYRSDLTDTAFKILNIKKVQGNDYGVYYHFENSNHSLVDVKGFDAMVPFSSGTYQQESEKLNFDGNSLQVYLSNADGKFTGAIDQLRFKVGTQSSSSVSLKPTIVSLYQLAKAGKIAKIGQGQNFSVPFQKMEGYIPNRIYTVKYVITGFNADFKQGPIPYHYINIAGYILIKKR